MGSTTIFNKVEIMLYSTLTSILSGINRLKAQEQSVSRTLDESGAQVIDNLAPVMVPTAENTASSKWETIQQELLSLLFWIVLGFAAGFLIGMINNG